MTHRVLLVGGDFSENPRPSGYVRKLHEELSKLGLFQIMYHNGGSIAVLEGYVQKANDFDIIMWFANVPNTYTKSVNLIKGVNPNVILVTSKNNMEGIYSYPQIVSRMLATKANLSLVFTKASEDGKVQCTVLDPLANAYALNELDVSKVASTLAQRAIELHSFVRVGSVQSGEHVVAPINESFFNIARSFAELFHSLIHAGETDRYLGNLSFRCTRGFPTFKHEDLIYVSRRNIDKRSIGRDGFVAVTPELVNGKVSYYGDAKPSVDTPVQIELYKKYPSIKYMLHSHVYITGGIFTKEKIPCGAVEEVDSICQVLPPGEDVMYASINLLGHGSIVMANSLTYFDQISYYGRDIPETA
jgi:hypothetical protein